jgi:hypothetical protein
MKAPKLEATPAIQRLRKTAWRSGSHPDGRGVVRRADLAIEVKESS